MVTFSQEFSDCGLIEFTVQAVASRDGYGQPVYGAAVTYKGRWVKANKLVKGPNGSMVTSSHQVWMDYVAEIDSYAKFNFPGSEPFHPIGEVEKFPDEMGWSHMKVYFQ